MIIALFALYFCIALAILWIVVLPEQAIRLLRHLLRLFALPMMGIGSCLKWLKRRMARGLRAIGFGGTGLGRYLKRHRLAAACILILLTFPSLLVLHLTGSLDFSRFVAKTHKPNAVVAQLLEGEQLVPPQPLPPTVFTTRQVETVRPDLVFANRKWDKLKPDFRQRLLAVLKRMENKYGYHMVLIEGYRSPARQQRLMESGSNVTHASAGQSYHQYGLAADCAFYRNGQLLIRRDSAWIKRGYKLYGQVAQELGLTWGGNWSFHDYGHVEYKRSKYDDPTKHRASQATTTQVE